MKKDPYKRKLKVETLILKELSDIIFHEIKDPRVEGTIISKVKISDNLNIATVYIVPQKEADKQMMGLKSATGFVRTILKKRLCMRSIPSIFFEIDDEYGTIKEEGDAEKL